mmetsp:Transcript_28183/g.45287  ORF Transcript_28183/g.45287 Transcript_28183/m.45287 type:complete len:840 (-) Transcript_28183:118-2637(-)|eukprot:CAMPEP_0203763054 /NCGR_PEP_ID=MMETSP0098-20131031/15767_1 /ASSEMBLY_ACC=CAM_ASM_000208 /TAXON_ID=96639 /ORGANISM=" , Strain NY0313808BC1" /LENGTH=839 /DNA_ID=CAMNT_0050657657 /DNA_START=377 /DNA_END=2896 /DNA_ORIENTATION=-
MDDLLNIEKRTGVTEDELAEFEAKTSQVSELIRGLKEGTIKPEDVKVPGEKTEEEIRLETERKERLRVEKEKKLKEAKEKEQKDWWERAELIVGMTREQAWKERDERLTALAAGKRSKRVSGTGKDEQIVITDDDGVVLFPKPKAKSDALDYSVWDKWIPDDPASLEEMQRAKDDIEDERNREFEQANPEFCQQFKDDQEKREEARMKKEKDGEKLKVRGNRFFKRKQYEEALKAYHDALLIIPLDLAVLGNIAQVLLRCEKFDEALEFCERSLFLDPDHTKSLWRHAKASIGKQGFEVATADLRHALLLNPENSEIERLLKNCEEELLSQKAEATIETAKQRFGEEEDVLKNIKKIIPADENSISASNSKQLLDLLDDPLLAISMGEKMCKEIAGGTDRAVTAMQQNAVSGLMACWTKSDSKLEKAQLCTLMRTTGALNRLCSWVQGNVGPAMVSELLVQSIMESSKNMEIFREKGVFGYLLEKEKPNLKLLEILAKYEGFRYDITQSTKTMSSVASLLQNPTDPDCPAAVVLVLHLSMFDTSRKDVLNMQANVVLSLIEMINAKNDVALQTNASAALANFCQERKAKAILCNNVDSLLKTTILEPRRVQLETTSNILGAIMNTCLETSSPCRDTLSQPVYVEALVNLTGNTCENVQVRERSAALLSRLLTDPKHGKRVVTDVLNQDPKFLSKLKGIIEKPSSPDLMEHSIRSIAVLLKYATENSQLELLEPLTSYLEACGRSIQAGDISSPITLTNLVQCFVQLATHSANIAKKPVFAKKIIPALIKLIQYTEDGPVRKNAAVAIAKLAKTSAKNMETIRSLRGMEMLMELGDRLVT